VKAWVNYSCRSYPIYPEIKAELGREIMNISYAGNNWGVACNSIHFIDLFDYLSGEFDFTFDATKIDNVVYPSKRAGFSEMHRILRISTQRG